MIIDFTSQVEKYKFPVPLSSQIQECTNYIMLHLNESLNSRDVIEHSSLSKSALSRQFHKETGYTIGEYITKCKIDEARSLLKYTERTIADIINYLGFSSQPYFHNFFRKVTGKTPLEYRNNL